MTLFKNTTLIIVALAALGLAGCNDTAAGMAEDTAENSRAVAEGAEQVGEEVKETADDVAEAGEDALASQLTARIKSSYVANPILNEDNVKIDVDSTADSVELNGTVGTKEQHEMAISIAEKVIEEAGDGQKLVDNLTVSG